MYNTLLGSQVTTRRHAPAQNEGVDARVIVEWWFYTGHLCALNGERYGFEIVFSKGHIKDDGKSIPIPFKWLVDPLYVASFTIADEVRHAFKYDTRVSMLLPWLAGAESHRLRLWNRGWRVEGKDGMHHLLATINDYAVDLQLCPSLPFLQGHQGVLQLEKSRTSSFYSYPKMSVCGTVSVMGVRQSVKGYAWMIHQWSNSTEANYPAWDWFDLKLDNGYALQIFNYREASNVTYKGSSGVLIYPNGRAEPLKPSMFDVRPLHKWIDPHRGVTFPVDWEIVIPEQSLNLKVRPVGADRESYTLQMFYWRGAVIVEGWLGNLPLTGKGEIEMTGHARS